jgi:glycosyltransferase involved in cell wall biosynthesis
MEGKMKRILMLTSGNIDHPSSRIRGVQYISDLEKAGYQVIWLPKKVDKLNRKNNVLNPIYKRLYFLNQIFGILFRNFDILFIQRQFFPEFVLKFAKKRFEKIIFDFDDSIFLNQKNLINVDPKNEKKTLLMFKYSTTIITSTPYLTDYCKNKGFDAETITTPVDIIETKLINNEKKLTIGWIGSNTNTVHLYELENVFKKLAVEFDYQLFVVGANKNFNIEGINIVKKDWSLKDEPVYLSQFDIGIMPLLNNVYSIGKGGYKIYVYMSYGIPVVAQSIGINSTIIGNGVNGFAAENEDQWYAYLNTLMKSPDLRRKMGESGKQQVRDYYSRTVTFKKLLKILTC